MPNADKGNSRNSRSSMAATSAWQDLGKATLKTAGCKNLPPDVQTVVEKVTNGHDVTKQDIHILQAAADMTGAQTNGQRRASTRLAKNAENEQTVSKKTIGPPSFWWISSHPWVITALLASVCFYIVVEIFAWFVRLRHGNQLGAQEFFIAVASIGVTLLFANLLYWRNIRMAKDRFFTPIFTADKVLINPLMLCWMVFVVCGFLESVEEQQVQNEQSTIVYGDEIEAAMNTLFYTPHVQFNPAYVRLYIVIMSLLAWIANGKTMQGRTIVTGCPKTSATDTSYYEHGTRMQTGLALIMLMLGTIVTFTFPLQAISGKFELEERGPSYWYDKNTRHVKLPQKLGGLGDLYWVTFRVKKTFSGPFQWGINDDPNKKCMVDYGGIDMELYSDMKNLRAKLANHTSACKSKKDNGMETAPANEIDAMFRMFMYPSLILRLAAFILLWTELADVRAIDKTAAGSFYFGMLPSTILYGFMQCHVITDAQSWPVVVWYIGAWGFHEYFPGSSGQVDEKSVESPDDINTAGFKGAVRRACAAVEQTNNSNREVFRDCAKLGVAGLHLMNTAMYFVTFMIIMMKISEVHDNVSKTYQKALNQVCSSTILSFMHGFVGCTPP